MEHKLQLHASEFSLHHGVLSMNSKESMVNLCLVHLVAP